MPVRVPAGGSRGALARCALYARAARPASRVSLAVYSGASLHRYMIYKKVPFISTQGHTHPALCLCVSPSRRHIFIYASGMLQSLRAQDHMYAHRRASYTHSPRVEHGNCSLYSPRTIKLAGRFTLRG